MNRTAHALGTVLIAVGFLLIGEPLPIRLTLVGAGALILGHEDNDRSRPAAC